MTIKSKYLNYIGKMNIHKNEKVHLNEYYVIFNNESKLVKNFDDAFEFCKSLNKLSDICSNKIKVIYFPHNEIFNYVNVTPDFIKFIS